MSCCRCWMLFVVAAWPLVARSARAEEIPSVMGWKIAQPTAGTHRVGTQLGAARTGRGCGQIVGSAADHGARAAFTQEFSHKTALKPGRTYRYEVSYRTDVPLAGTGLLLIDSYTRAGEAGRKELVSQVLKASAEWKTLSGEIVVPAQVVRVRMLLYLRGQGTIYFDDAFLGDKAAGAPNLLKNGGFEPPACCVYDLAPARPSGKVKFSADFPGGTLGAVKQLGPDEFYVHAFADGRPHSPFLWFYFRVDGCQGRELTIHVNPAPFSQDKTGGNGTRSPVVSDDGEHWRGVSDKSWNEDGTALTFKHRFAKSPAWIASFFPFTAEHIARFAADHKSNPCFTCGTLGKSRQGRPLPLWTITDPAVPEAQKRVILFITLQHDLETTGAMALEGMCRFLLETDPRAARLRRQFVFYVVPMMNPDGIAAGNLYCPVGNMNRQWGRGTAPETMLVERFAKGLTAKGRKIELFMDFHGWCTPERTTLFLTLGPEIAGVEAAKDAERLAATIKPRLRGKVNPVVWHKLTDYVGPSLSLRYLSCGWMQSEAPARLAYSIEIFGEGECTQEQYLAWGRAFAAGIAEFYAAGR